MFTSNEKPTFFILLFLIILTPVISFADADTLPPEGWRYPVESDYEGDWARFRNKIPIPFHVKADFNGDGLLDDAWILIRTKKVGWGLFVFLGEKDDKTKIIQLMDDYSISYFSVGITLVPPGRYKTACAQGLGPECEPGELKEFELANPGFDFLYFEASGKTFYWNKETKEFKSIWTSD